MSKLIDVILEGMLLCGMFIVTVVLIGAFMTV